MPADDAPRLESWRPCAGVELLRRRAELLAHIRRFFAERGVLEVETPLLAHRAATDVHLHSLQTRWRAEAAPLYLQTSPEHCMKRLLAAGSGPIYQICKAFRDDEHGRLHNPEFTLLEWYRPGFDHHALMREIEALLGETLGCAKSLRLSYKEAFLTHAGCDPSEEPLEALRARAVEQGVGIEAARRLDRDECLSLLIDTLVQPRLGPGAVFVYDYPASQASLARVRGDVAERFELFVNGVELANGYHELTDAEEQGRRFAADAARRREAGLEVLAADERLMSALRAGMPACAGVAVGVDRLLMLLAGRRHISEVLAWPTPSA